MTILASLIISCHLILTIHRINAISFACSLFKSHFANPIYSNHISVGLIVAILILPMSVMFDAYHIDLHCRKVSCQKHAMQYAKPGLTIQVTECSPIAVYVYCKFS